MGKLPKPASDFLQPDDVQDGDIVEIVKHPETIPAEQTKYGRERHVVTVVLPSRAEKRWGLNQTSYRTLYKAFGDDGTQWIGRQVKVVKNRENVRGETRYVLYAEPATPQPQQASLVADQQFNKQLEKLGVKPEAFNQLSGEEQARLLRKMNMQQ
jgi:hypothetical protein